MPEYENNGNFKKRSYFKINYYSMAELSLPTAYEVWGKVMFSQVYVCSQLGLPLEVGGLHGGEVCMEWANPRPRDTVNRQLVHILLECFLVFRIRFKVKGHNEIKCGAALF